MINYLQNWEFGRQCVIFYHNYRILNLIKTKKKDICALLYFTFKSLSEIT